MRHIRKSLYLSALVFNRPIKHYLTSILLALFIFGPSSTATAGAEADTSINKSKKIVFLGTKFQNDHKSQEPTSDSERSRIKAVEEIFKKELENTGNFTFVPLTDEIKSKILTGQAIGECGGCEFDYGNSLNADISAWILIQKVSNLILNINLYMVDIHSRKIILTQSVDIRGNTDLSWTKGMKYLIQHHVIPK